MISWTDIKDEYNLLILRRILLPEQLSIQIGAHVIEMVMDSFLTKDITNQYSYNA